MISVHESTGKSNWYYQNSEVSIIPQSLVSVYVYKSTLLWFLVCYFSKSSNYIDNWRRYVSYLQVCVLVNLMLDLFYNELWTVVVGGEKSKYVWDVQ